MHTRCSKCMSHEYVIRHHDADAILAGLVRTRTSPLRCHRTLSANDLCPQICVPHMGRPFVGGNQHHLRTENQSGVSPRRVREFLGGWRRLARERFHCPVAGRNGAAGRGVGERSHEDIGQS